MPPKTTPALSIRIPSLVARIVPLSTIGPSTVLFEMAMPVRAVITPLLLIPPEIAATPFSIKIPSIDAVIVPLLLIAAPALATPTNPLLFLTTMPIGARILPLLLTLPKIVLTWSTLTPVSLAEIVPRFTMPPPVTESPNTLPPKKRIPRKPEITPVLLMAPANVPTNCTLMPLPFPPAPTVPRLVMPPLNIATLLAAMAGPTAPPTTPPAALTMPPEKIDIKPT